MGEENNTLLDFGPVENKMQGIIKVIGVGGGGCNAVRNMYNEGVDGVSYAVCNTDSKGVGCVYALANISHDAMYDIEPGGSSFGYVKHYLSSTANVWCVNKGGNPVKGTLHYVAEIN